MATKTKPGGAAQTEKPVDSRKTYVLKGDPRWFDWLERLSLHTRLPISVLMDRAVVKLAREEGFAEEAPRR